MKKLAFLLLLLPLGIMAQDTLIVAADGSGDYTRVQAAFDALPNGTPAHLRVILIKAGIYKEKLVLDRGKNRVKIQGAGAEKTILSWNDHTGKVVDGDTLNTYSSYTFSIRADEVTVQDLTIENTAGPVGQAVACETQGDRIAFYRCALLSHQDTFFTKGAVARVYAKDCRIVGTTDFIFGPSIALFDDCQIHCLKNSYITAASTTERNAYGYVFRRCTLTADSAVSKMYLGRPWRSFAKTVFLQCHYLLPLRPEGWHHWIPERERTAFYAEYQCSGPSANSDQRVAWSHQLTPEQASLYTKAKIFAKNTVSEPFAHDWLPE